MFLALLADRYKLTNAANSGSRSSKVRRADRDRCGMTLLMKSLNARRTRRSTRPNAVAGWSRVMSQVCRKLSDSSGCPAGSGFLRDGAAIIRTNHSISGVVPRP